MRILYRANNVSGRTGGFLRRTRAEHAVAADRHRLSRGVRSRRDRSCEQNDSRASRPCHPCGFQCAEVIHLLLHTYRVMLLTWVYISSAALMTLVLDS